MEVTVVVDIAQRLVCSQCVVSVSSATTHHRGFVLLVQVPIKNSSRKDWSFFVPSEVT